MTHKDSGGTTDEALPVRTTLGLHVTDCHGARCEAAAEPGEETDIFTGSILSAARHPQIQNSSVSILDLTKSLHACRGVIRSDSCAVQHACMMRCGQTAATWMCVEMVFHGVYGKHLCYSVF